MLKIGDDALYFRAKNQDGIEVSIKDFKDKWIVLYFYPKDNTPGCTIEACDFTLNIEEFKKLDAVVIGVSADSAKSHKKFADKYELRFSLLVDDNHSIMKSYGAWRLKKNFGKEYMGVVRSTSIIDDKGKIAYIWDNVKAKGHVNEVRDKLKQIRSH